MIFFNPLSFFDKFNTHSVSSFFSLPMVFLLGAIGSLGSLYSPERHWFFLFAIFAFVVACLFCKLKGRFVYWFAFWISFLNAPLFMSYLVYVENHPITWVFMGFIGVSIYAFFYSLAFVIGNVMSSRFFKGDVFISFGISVLFFLIFYYLLQSFFPIAPLSPGLVLAFSPFVGIAAFFGDLGLNFLFFVFSFAFVLLFFRFRLIPAVLFIFIFLCYLFVSPSVGTDRIVKSVSVYFYGHGIVLNEPLDVDVVLGNEYAFVGLGVSDLKSELSSVVDKSCVDCDLIGHFAEVEPDNRIVKSSLFFYYKEIFSTQLKEIYAFPSEISLFGKLKHGFQSPLGILSSNYDYVPFLSSKTGLMYGGLVCLDSSFPEVVRGVSLSGVDLLFNPSSVSSVRSYYLMNSLLSSNIVSSVSVGRIIVKNITSSDSFVFFPNGKVEKTHDSGQAFVIPFFSFNTFFLHWGSLASLCFLFFLLSIFLFMRVYYVKYK